MSSETSGKGSKQKKCYFLLDQKEGAAHVERCALHLSTAPNQIPSAHGGQSPRGAASLNSMDDQTLQSALQRAGQEFHRLHTMQGQRTQEKNQLQQNYDALAAGAAVYAAAAPGHPHAGGGSGLQPGLFAASSFSPQPPPQQMMQHMQPSPQQMQQMQQQQQFQLMQQAAGPVASSSAGSSISSLSSGNSGVGGGTVGGSGIEKYD